jgi:hypothetical protein
MKKEPASNAFTVVSFVAPNKRPNSLEGCQIFLDRQTILSLSLCKERMISSLTQVRRGACPRRSQGSI